MALTLRCTECGEPLPDMDADTERAVAAAITTGTPITLRHDSCVPEAAEAQSVPLRRYEAALTITELTTAPGHDGQETKEIGETMIAGFTAAASAPSFAAALPALVDSLGEKWAKLAEHAALADADPQP